MCLYARYERELFRTAGKLAHRGELAMIAASVAGLDINVESSICSPLINLCRRDALAELGLPD